MSEELFRRYETCLTVLAHCRHAMTRETWQEGPTETEAVQEVNELLNEREQDREMAQIQAQEPKPTPSTASDKPEALGPEPCHCCVCQGAAAKQP